MSMPASDLPPDHLEQGPVISVITPTRNEIATIGLLIGAMPSEVGSIIVADDSDDGTERMAEAAGRAYGRQVLVIHRTKAERGSGLAGAVMKAWEYVQSEWTVVMDADGQHPYRMATELVAVGQREDLDVVVGTRYAAGGSPGTGLDGPWRRLVSVASNLAARRLLPELAGVSDPMSGLFAVRTRHLAMLRDKDPRGYKILMELLLGEHLKVGEVGYRFQSRVGGKSKAALPEGLRFVRRLNQLRRDKNARPVSDERWSSLRVVQGERPSRLQEKYETDAAFKSMIDAAMSSRIEEHPRRRRRPRPHV